MTANPKTRELNNAFLANRLIAQTASLAVSPPQTWHLNIDMATAISEALPLAPVQLMQCDDSSPLFKPQPSSTKSAIPVQARSLP